MRPPAGLAPGSARLAVSDGVNTTFSTPITISVGSPPTASILSPQDGRFFVAGDVIGYSGDATDPDDGTLPASAFTWKVIFHHDDHIHPFLGPLAGITGGSFTIPDLGEAATDVWYEVLLTVTDSQGVATTEILQLEGLTAGNVVAGPAIVEHSATTFAIPPGRTAALDRHLIFHLSAEEA